MEAELNHIQLNIQPANMAFYRDLMLGYLGWKVVYEMDGYFGAISPAGGASLWFLANGTSDANNDYDGRGMNHLAFGVKAQSDIEAATDWLKERGIEALFGTPLMDTMPPPNDTQIYYRVMFATPDNILLEFSCSGARS